MGSNNPRWDNTMPCLAVIFDAMSDIKKRSHLRAMNDQTNFILNASIDRLTYFRSVSMISIL